MKSWDFLNSLTKDEIIKLLKKDFWVSAPEKNRSDWFLYEIKFENYMKRQEKHDAISTAGMNYEQVKKHFAKSERLNKEYDVISREGDRLVGRVKG